MSAKIAVLALGEIAPGGMKAMCKMPDPKLAESIPSYINDNNEVTALRGMIGTLILSVTPAPFAAC